MVIIGSSLGARLGLGEALSLGTINCLHIISAYR